MLKNVSILVQLTLAYVVLVSGLILNFLQLLTLLTWPYNKKLYRKLNYYIQYSLMSIFTCLAQYWSGTRIELYVENEDVVQYFAKEHIIAVPNHKYDLDWILGMILCQNLGFLGGTKQLFKESVKYLPVLGWLWTMAEHIFLKRNWEKDNVTLSNHLRSIFEFPDNHFIVVIIFCEGTRFSEKKHQASLEYAKLKGLPELKHHLLPRTKGFTLMAKECSNNVKAIYDVNFGVEKVNGQQPSINMIFDGDKINVKVFLRRIPLENIPFEDEQKCSEFVHKLYIEKDKIFDTFDRTGDFTECGGIKLNRKLNNYDLYTTIGWLILILTPTYYYLFKTLIFGSLFFKLVFVFVILSVFVLMKVFMRYSKSKYGSSYGLKSPTKKTQ